MKHLKISALAVLFFTTISSFLFTQDSDWKNNYPTFVCHLYNPYSQSDLLEQWKNIKIQSGNGVVRLFWDNGGLANDQLSSLSEPSSSYQSLSDTLFNSNQPLTAQDILQMQAAGQIVIKDKKTEEIIRQVAQLEKQAIEKAIKLEQERIEALHIAQYGVTYDYLWNKKTGLYRNRDFKEVERQILNNYNLTRVQAVNVWQGYCNKRCGCDIEKSDGLLRISSEFAHREAEQNKQKAKKGDAVRHPVLDTGSSYDKKQKEEQDVLQQQRMIKLQQETSQQVGQQRCIEQEQKQQLLQKYNPEILHNCDDSCISSYQQQREQALQQTIQDGGKQHIQTHAIDPQTQVFMQLHDIDHHQFESLSGTIFSHQLFQEAAEHFKKAAKGVFEYGLKNSTMISHLVSFAQVTFESTKAGQFVLATRLSDIAEMMADGLLQMCKGVIECGCNIIDVFRYPKQFAKQLAMGVIALSAMEGGAMAAYDNESSTVGISSYDACFQAFDGNMILFNQMCDIARQQFEQSSWQDKIQAASRIACDCTLTPFLIGKAFKGCVGLLSQAQEALVLSRAVEMAEDLGLCFQEAEQLLLATEAGMQKLPASALEIEAAMTSLMESETQNILKNKAFSNNAKTSFNQVREKLLREGAAHTDTLFQAEVFSHFNGMFRNNEHCRLSTRVQELFDQVPVIYNGKNMKLICKPEHVLTPDLKFQLNKATNLVEGRIYGSHYSRVTEYLQKQGLIEVIEEHLLYNGRAIKYKHPFGNFVEIKTEFTAKLAQEQIMTNIVEVVNSENHLYLDTWFNGFKQKIHKIGKAHDGTIIEVFLLEKTKDELLLETAYPYFEMFSKVKGLTWKP